MESLSFDAVNDVALFVQRRSGRADVELRTLSANELGPLAELYLFLEDWRLDIEDFHGIAKSTLGQLFIKARSSNAPAFRKSSDMSYAVLQLTRWTGTDDDLAVTQFDYEAQQRARHIGVPLEAAQSLVGAIRELRDNVIQHSERPATGLLAFAALPNRFEFCVADRGIGVLSSLRQNPQYHYLKHSGQAIQVAIRPGESRLGRDSGHGMGFADLFRGLQKLSSHVRFRTGDYALEIPQGKGRIPEQKLSQVAMARGFLISVTCHLGPQEHTSTSG